MAVERGKVQVELITFQLDWTDPAIREKFTEDACDFCYNPLDELRTVELFLKPYPGGKVASTELLCSVACRDLAIHEYREGLK